MSAALADDYCADPFRSTEWDGSLDLEPLGAELTNADVLVGDIRLPVLEAVRLRPRPGFAWSPTCAPGEEQRLNLRRLSFLRRLCPRARRRDTEARNRSAKRSAMCSSCFTEVRQAIVIEAHDKRVLRSLGFQHEQLRSIRHTLDSTGSVVMLSDRRFAAHTRSRKK